MLKLHGFSASNYYNIAKLTLLEKNVEFEEVLTYTGAGEKYRPDYLEMSPQGKVPCLQTDEGFLTETRCIVSYLEDVFPDPPLFPTTPFARAKVNELALVIDLYFELPARRVLRNLFSQTKPPQSVADEVRETLRRTTTTLQRLARFDNYLIGDRFSAADVSAIIHFPVVRLLSQSVLDFDPLKLIPGIGEYLARLEERPTVKRVRVDRDKNFPGFIAHLQRLYAR